MATAKRVREFHIDLFYDKEAGVYGATGKRIPGLFLEAETVGGFMDALVEYAPELIEHNLKIPLDGGRFRFVTASAEIIPAKSAGKPKKPDERTSRPHMEVSFPRMEDYIPSRNGLRVADFKSEVCRLLQDADWYKLKGLGKGSHEVGATSYGY